jgi:hypothetical protein
MYDVKHQIKVFLILVMFFELPADINENRSQIAY